MKLPFLALARSFERASVLGALAILTLSCAVPSQSTNSSAETMGQGGDGPTDPGPPGGAPGSGGSDGSGTGGAGGGDLGSIGAWLGHTLPETCDRPPCDARCPDEGCSTLSIFVVDIGQGDATVVMGPMVEGHRVTMVMDAGNRHPDGGAIVSALLESQEATSVDYVVLSHFDGDHIGGFVTISGSTSLLWQSPQCEPTSWFPTVAIFDQGTDTNQSSSSAQWKSCVPTVAQQNGVTHLPVEAGAQIGTELDLGGGFVATIVAGDGYVIDSSDRVADVNTPNERSIALLISNDFGFDFLVTGDLIGQAAGAENAAVEVALGRALVDRAIDVEVLRAGHHGAANASAPQFLADIAPEVVVISTGNDQSPSYQHPRCETYEAVSTSMIGTVLQTELGNSDCADAPPIVPTVVNGTIRIDVSGADYEIRNEGAFSPANGEPTVPLRLACTVARGCGN